MEGSSSIERSTFEASSSIRVHAAATPIGPTSVQVLARAFSILKLFTEESPSWTLSAIARQTGLKASTTHRIVQVLRSEGYLGRDEVSKQYRLGMAAVELGNRARRSLGGKAASQALRWLSMVTGETAFLLVPSEDNRESVCIERVEGSQPLRLTVEIGRRIPIHAGAGQKVLLAFMDGEDRETVLRGPLVRLCKNTIVDPDQLRADLATIRERGWSSSFEESHEGTWAIAIPILDSSGHLAVGLCLAGPLLRHSQELPDVWRRECFRAASSIAEALGLHTPDIQA